MNNRLITAKTAALALNLAIGGGMVPSALAAPQDYRFELAGTPFQAGGIGKHHETDSRSVVQVRLIRAVDGIALSSATFIEVGADMSPDGMPRMAAHAEQLTSFEQGIYRFAVHPSMSGGWMLRLTAKIPGEPDVIHGTVPIKLIK